MQLRYSSEEILAAPPMPGPTCSGPAGCTAAMARTGVVLEQFGVLGDH
jgi:hypothetical protein